MASPRIPSRMEEIDPPYIPYTRAKHPILATIMPSIIRAVPPRILERLIMTKSSIGMLEEQLVCLLFRQALLDRQASSPDCSPRNSHDVGRVRAVSHGRSTLLTTGYEDSGSYEESSQP